MTKKTAKYLIINADDFGLNKEQNEAIKDLLNNKLITSHHLRYQKWYQFKNKGPETLVK